MTVKKVTRKKIVKTNRKNILYARISRTNRDFIKAQTKRLGISEALIVDNMISQARKNGNIPVVKAKSARKS